ncbi:hypothetical protein EBX93_06965 [bacterium]|jgi:hypothetical protein|nr:hypothetical protein [bacterium]
MSFLWEASGKMGRSFQEDTTIFGTEMPTLLLACQEETIWPFADGFQAAFVELLPKPCCSNAQHLNCTIFIVTRIELDEKKTAKFTSSNLGEGLGE